MTPTLSTDSKEMNRAESSSQSEDMESEAGSRRTGEDEADVEENAEVRGESSNSSTPGALTAQEERKSKMEQLRRKIVRLLHRTLSFNC